MSMFIVVTQMSDLIHVATLWSHDSHMTNNYTHTLAHLLTKALSWAMPKCKQGEWRYCAPVQDPSLRLELKRVLEVPFIPPN